MRQQRTTTDNSIAFFVASVLYLLVFTLALAIPTLYYAFEEEDADCQKGYRAGMILSDWLKGCGFADVIFLFIVLVFMYQMIMKNRDMSFAILTFSMGALIFKFIWFVIGIVIVSTNENNRCVSDGNALGVMAIINLVFYWLLSGLSASRKSD